MSSKKRTRTTTSTSVERKSKRMKVEPPIKGPDCCICLNSVSLLKFEKKVPYKFSTIIGLSNEEKQCWAFRCKHVMHMDCYLNFASKCSNNYQCPECKAKINEMNYAYKFKKSSPNKIITKTTTTTTTTRRGEGFEMTTRTMTHTITVELGTESNPIVLN